jgi:hypothetical protein
VGAVAQQIDQTDQSQRDDAQQFMLQCECLHMVICTAAYALEDPVGCSETTVQPRFDSNAAVL